MSHVEGNVVVGGAGWGQDNRTPVTPPFIFLTPPAVCQSQAYPTRSERNIVSVAIIVDLWEQLEAQDAEMQRHDQAIEWMQQAMRDAVLLSSEDEKEENEEPREVIV